MRLIVESGANRRRENLPTSNEMAAIIPDELDGAGPQDLVLVYRNTLDGRRELSKVHVTHPSYMPLHYVLLFVYGEYGWHWGIDLRENNGPRQKRRLEQRPFYRYYMHTRKEWFNTIHYAGRLFQQFAVDILVICESTALSWLRKNQRSICADVYNGLADAISRDDVNIEELGRRIVLPSSYTGSDHAMQQLYQDSMAIVRHFGKPTFFITFTANPKWPEITDALFPGQQATDRPDLIARVFHLKVRSLLTDLKGGLLGEYAGHVYTIEYQKRGLPHMHLLLFVKGFIFNVPNLIDEVVCAELPNPSWDVTGELTDVVISTMTHSPCGENYPDALCMVRKTPTSPLRCSKNFLKPFTASTIVNDEGYPEYRRRDDGRTFTVPQPGRGHVSVAQSRAFVASWQAGLQNRRLRRRSTILVLCVFLKRRQLSSLSNIYLLAKCECR